MVSQARQKNQIVSKGGLFYCGIETRRRYRIKWLDMICICGCRCRAKNIKCLKRTRSLIDTYRDRLCIYLFMYA